MKKRILIIDDSCEVCKWLGKFFGRKCVVTECTTLDDASEELRVNDFDVIISDISIPDQDGDDFILSHRDHIGGANVVFISANDEDRLIQAKNKLIENGIMNVSWIQKPIVLKALLDLI